MARRNTVNGEVGDTSDGHITLRLLLEGGPRLSPVSLPEEDERRAGRGITGWLTVSGEEVDHAPDESEGRGWWLRCMAIAAASAVGAREKAVKEARTATNTNLGVTRIMLGGWK
jgi:hypothetical protein